MFYPPRPLRLRSFQRSLFRDTRHPSKQMYTRQSVVSYDRFACNNTLYRWSMSLQNAQFIHLTRHNQPHSLSPSISVYLPIYHCISYSIDACTYYLQLYQCVPYSIEACLRPINEHVCYTRSTYSYHTPRRTTRTLYVVL